MAPHRGVPSLLRPPRGEFSPHVLSRILPSPPRVGQGFALEIRLRDEKALIAEAIESSLARRLEMTELPDPSVAMRAMRRVIAQWQGRSLVLAWWAWYTGALTARLQAQAHEVTTLATVIPPSNSHLESIMSP